MSPGPHQSPTRVTVYWTLAHSRKGSSNMPSITDGSPTLDPRHIRLGLASEIKDRTQVDLVWLAGLGAWLCGFDLLWRTRDLVWPVVTMVCLAMTAILSSALRKKATAASRGIVVLGILAGYFVFVMGHPSAEIRYLIIPILILFTSLLSSTWRLATCLTACSGLVLLEAFVVNISIGWGTTAYLVGLALLSTVLSIVAVRHLAEAIDWAGESAARSMALAEELRERQLLLNRALRSMDEASERLMLSNRRLAEARETASEALQAKARFVASVSHELRTPLNLIVGFTDVMYNSTQTYTGAVLSPRFLLDLGTVYRNAQHLSKLIDDVLDLAQMNSGKFALEVAPTDIASLVAEATDAVRGLATTRGLRLMKDVSSELPTVYTDRVRLKQVLLNLLSNAVRYTDSGSVSVTASHADGAVVIAVKDTGRGIAQEDQGRLFREFEHIGEPTSSAQKGFGLGLAITKRFVGALGGHIELQSAVGQGSTFTVTIPLRVDALCGTTLKTPPSALNASSPAVQDSILFVAPNPAYARAFARNTEDYRCIAVPDTPIAMRSLQSMQPRAVLVDDQMSEEDIRTLAAALASVPVQSVPLIVCPTPREAWKPSADSTCGYLTKPVMRDDLVAMVHSAGNGVETILAVDDDEDILQLMVRFLESEAFHRYIVVTARNGTEALEVLSRTTPDLILLDVIMPGMDGPALLQRIRNDPRWSSIPVVWVSGNDLDERVATLTGWMKAQVPRGMDMSQLVRSVEGLVTSLRPVVSSEPARLSGFGAGNPA